MYKSTCKVLTYLGLGVVLQERSFFQGNELNGTNDFKEVGTRPAQGLGVVPVGNDRSFT